MEWFDIIQGPIG